MEKVSVLQFRRDAKGIIRRVQQGKRLILTYRGKPVMCLERIAKREIGPDDPFYRLDLLTIPRGKPLTNDEIDQIVYQR